MDSTIFPVDPTFFSITYSEKMLMAVRLQYWQLHIFGLPWYIITAPFFSWFIWWKFVDKKRIVEICFYGLLIAFIASALDEIGCMLSLWEYPYKVDPLFPRLASADFALFPVTYMLIYQKYPEWKGFLIVSGFQSLAFSFIFEPLLVKFGLYVLLSWSHAYSVLPYFLMAVFCKWLINLIFQLQETPS